MKCKNCGEENVRFPIKKQSNRTLVENFKEGTINWKNFFMIDLMSIIWIILLVFLVWSYQRDIAKCDNILDEPCDFCLRNECCEVDWEKIESTWQIPTRNINNNT